MSLAVLEHETKSRAFALVILKMLTRQAELGQGNSSAAVCPYYVLVLKLRRLWQKG